MDKLVSALLALYGPQNTKLFPGLLGDSDYKVWRYLLTFWTTQHLTPWTEKYNERSRKQRLAWLIVLVGECIEIGCGLLLALEGLRTQNYGLVTFGAAVIIAYPVVWAHGLAFVWGIYKVSRAVTNPKQTGRESITAVLVWQVQRLRARHNFTLIAVAGSIGKTSTKLAIAHTLEPTRRVIYQTGNYNVPITVPLVLFGRKLPNLFNAIAWLKILWANEQTIRANDFYDMAVLELGTDYPGELSNFVYLKPDILVITAITAEHMENFKTLEAVAHEELSLVPHARTVIVNADDVDTKYLAGHHVKTYSIATQADYHATTSKRQRSTGPVLSITTASGKLIKAPLEILGKQGAKIVLAAAAAADAAGLDVREISKGLAQIKPAAGRMQLLKGVRNSLLIDDTYNASPVPVMAGLDVLYGMEAPQRIAILGSMNELGDYSEQAHREVGQYCRADKLDLVVTIGHDAEKYLAPVAAEQGCTVKSYTSPYSAGAYVSQQLKAGAIVLGEGSQNGVFAEEALKPLLAQSSDAAKLVRQSDHWMRIKRSQFADAPK